MIEGRVIRGVDLNASTFIQSFKRIKDQNLQAEIIATLRTLLVLHLDQTPAKLHLHQLTSRQVASRVDSHKKVTPWSLHVTANDQYKASFTLEGGTAYFRLVDEHDVIDKNP